MKKFDEFLNEEQIKIEEKILNTLKDELKKGIEIEHEHLNTYNFIEKYIKEHEGKMPPKFDFYESIAKDHLDGEGYSKYYTFLSNMEVEMNKLKKE
jgi:hypothetical protein